VGVGFVGEVRIACRCEEAVASLDGIAHHVILLQLGKAHPGESSASHQPRPLR
jgi:hypothetical protein